MKRVLILFCACLLMLLCGCRNSQVAEDTTGAEVTEAVANTEPAITETKNSFEFESEIDFSDFDTAPETQPTEPEENRTPTQAPTQPQPTEPVVTPTQKPTEPVEKPTEPETTEPEETQAPTTATPSIGADGYNNQIVRP